MSWDQPTNTVPENVTIVAGNFWPDVTTGEFRDLYRIPAELPQNTVVDHLRLAAVRVRAALKSWASLQEAATLVEVDQEEIDGTGELVMLWRRAVYCDAKAEILRETVTVDRRAEAENAAKSAPETEEKYREFSQDAIRQIVGMQRVTIELL